MNSSRSKIILLLGIGILMMSACSNQQVYDAIQQNRLAECKKLEGHAREECINNHSESYDKYDEDRRELN